MSAAAAVSLGILALATALLVVGIVVAKAPPLPVTKPIVISCIPPDGDTDRCLEPHYER